MEITATATPIENETNVKGLATAVIDGHLAIHGIKIVSRKDQLGEFISMPSWTGYDRNNQKVFHDIVFPITPESREQLSDAIFFAIGGKSQESTPTEKLPKISISLKKYSGLDKNIKAVGQITVNDAIVISGLKVIEGQNGAFMQMPSYQTANGDWKEIAHPITAEFREKLNNAVMAKFNDLQSEKIVGNIPYKNLDDEKSFQVINNPKFAEKLTAEMDKVGLKWSGKELNGKLTVCVNASDEQAFQNLQKNLTEMLKKQQEQQKTTKSIAPSKAFR